MATSGRPSGAAGRAPRSGRATASRRRRSRAALPTRTPPRPTPPRPKPATLTARAAILAVAVASVALALALPFKVWVAQRSEIAALESTTRQQQHRVDELRRQQDRWQDPAYVRQQARVRLHFAMPGETTYVVLSKPRAQHPRSGAADGTERLTGPWYSRMWQSVEAAGATRRSS